MKRIFSYILFLVSLNSFAQYDSTRPIRRINGDIVYFTVDNLNNLYILTATDQLKKFDNKGDSIAVFNNVTKHGKVSYMDVSNPMRVLIYYKDFSTIVELDRMLNVRNTIELRKHDIFQAQAVGLSYDNNIWVFDELQNKLKKINEKGELLFETSDFRQLFSEQPIPNLIFDQDGFVYLYDSLRGIFVFDYYGALKNKIPYRGLTNFKVRGKVIWGIRNDSIIAYHTGLFHELKTPLPPHFRGAISINSGPQRGYALRKEGLEVYFLE